jgi:trans-aconitate methyltransferase
MSNLLEEVKSYYATQVKRKLRDFVEGNDRVERAWQTLEQWAPPNPQRILEVGCGIGAICWRMSRRWPQAQIVGLDVSPESIELAKKLFSSPKLSFVEGILAKGVLPDKFDLIVLMDVYEHIAVQDRPGVHQMLKDILNDEGRIVLSFPTPRHQAWLRQHEPEEIQPIDEDIALGPISSFAFDSDCEILLYQEVGIWHEGDYAHAVLGKGRGWTAVKKGESRHRNILMRISELFSKKTAPLLPSRSVRLQLVRERLGSSAYV